MRHFTRLAALATLAATVTVVAAQPAIAGAEQLGAGAVTEQQNGVPPAVGNDSNSPSDPARTPVDPGAEYLQAFDAIAGAWAGTSIVGQVVGTASGIAVGCPLGAVTGGTLTLPTLVLTPVGVVGGCVVGAAALGFLGGVVGGIVSGGPSLANAIGEQYSSLRSKGLVSQQIPSDDSAQ
ncbi:hypothetical protein [Nocardia pseudovaccinii]|uniref:hypothetical protein n=1 Tax=Nocardia pseudovaccinii TaxID=189540 RepID=UPI0007A44453|nr:hypothetical protein [Nocardia pseudovaccinii]